jgi:hypothetical protein
LIEPRLLLTAFYICGGPEELDQPMAGPIRGGAKKPFRVIRGARITLAFRTSHDILVWYGRELKTQNQPPPWLNAHGQHFSQPFRHFESFTWPPQVKYVLGGDDSRLQ